MIVGVGYMPPREFFNIARVKQINFDWNKTAVVTRLENLSRFYETHSHVIYFDIPENLSRVPQVHLFDFRFLGIYEDVPIFVEKRPIWALIRYCVHAPRDRTERPTITARKEIMQSIIKVNKQNDVLDKLNLITSILPKAPLRKRAERAIIMFLTNEVSLNSAVEKLKSLKHGDKSYDLAINEFVEWTKLPVKDHLMSALSELLKKPDSWRDNIPHVSAAYGIRHFELGYIMSFLERQKA